MRTNYCLLSLLLALGSSAGCPLTAVVDDDAGEASDSAVVLYDANPAPDSDLMPPDASPPDASPPDASLPDAVVDESPDADSVAPDGGSSSSYDLSCKGTSPSSAEDPILFSGVLTDLLAGEGVSGVSVEVRNVADDALMASTTSNATGSFTVEIPTGGIPVNVYARVEKSGYKTVYIYPAKSLDKGFTFDQAPMIDDETLTFLYLAAAAWPSSAKATVGVVVVDCAFAPVEGATIELNPAAEDVLYITSIDPPSVGSTATSDVGLAVALNAPAGATTISAELSGFSFTDSLAKAYADALTFVLVQP